MSESRDRPDPDAGSPDAGSPDAGSLGAHPGEPRPVPEADVFVFRSVRQVSGTRQLPWASDELTLVFHPRGIEISGAHRGEHSAVPWASVTRVSRGASEAMPDGRTVTVIGIEFPGRMMRFAVTTARPEPVQLDALGDQVRRWSGADRPAGPPPVLPAPGASGAPASLPVPAPDLPVPTRPVSGAVSSTVAWTRQTWPSRGSGRPRRSWPRRSWPRPPRRRWRPRRIVTLALGLACLASGVGLAFALSGSDAPRSVPAPASAPLTPDQQLANGLMLTRSDLPAGWTVSPQGGSASASPKVQTGEANITRSFAGCMGIGPAQASIVLGGGGADQTAQTTSPVFVGPTSAVRPGFALEVQTAAAVVRDHQDEQRDLAVLADPRYPTCVGDALAAETQLGADSASGKHGRPGPASASSVAVPAAAGEQSRGVLVDFTVSDRSASVPVEVETVSLGHDRTEASLQALAIGGGIPADVIAGLISAFEQRVATGGRSTVA